MTALTKNRPHLQANTPTVEELVNQVKRGLVRVPSFQRPLQWKTEDVLLFFDSIYQGYPVGSFLMWQAPAPKSVIRYGPVQIKAPESSSALWVVDGQQRLTAFTVGLARDEEMPTTPEDVWVLYFDAENQEFHTPPRSGVIPSTWVPITKLLDASVLLEWVFNWQHSGDELLRNSIFEAGKRIRQYKIPVYIVETDEEELLRHIFYRVNNTGKKMDWVDVHDALFGRKSDEPSTLDGLADALQRFGIDVGRPSKELLLSAIIAFKGLDPTRSILDHYRREPELLHDASREALPAIKKVLTFLKTHAEIPHLRLLPRALPFVVLTKFFGLYPEPNSRTVKLLIRWIWRTLLAPKSVHENTLLRRSLKAIEDSEQEQAMQNLLDVIPRKKEKEFTLPQKFDARAADSRIVLLALSSMHPRDPRDGKSIDIADLIEKHDRKAFGRIIGRGTEATHGLSNRILLPPISGGIRKELIGLIKREGPDAKILRSHCIDKQAAEKLLNGEFDEFLLLRENLIEETVDTFGSKLAAWGMSDRPTVDYILQKTGGEE